MTSVRIEGFHAVKHALRFGATLTSLVTPDAAAVEALRVQLAPDLDLGAAGLESVDDATWSRLAPHGLPSPLLGMASPRPWSAEDLRRPGPIVVVEQPRHLGNLGAVVRVAAAADAAGVVVVGEADPWHPTVVRAAAGLHWAVPVLRVATIKEMVSLDAVAARRILALDERGVELHAASLTRGVVLLLGSERQGLSDVALATADLLVRIPMRAGVSSLNLATAAAVGLYAIPR